MAKKRNLKRSLIMAVCLLGIVGTAAGQIIYVDPCATGANDGTSWGDAYKYLQDALDVAGDGDDIWMAEGTYKPDENTANPGGTGSRTATFQLINGVALYGGFAGTETTLDERDWQTNETILSGDLNSDDVGFTNNGENSYHVVTGIWTEPNAVLDGFTITAGDANGSEPYDYGGGMYNYDASPTVTNCTFIGNFSSGASGGMSNDFNSSPTVTNCTFSGNSGAFGGGMSNRGSSPTVTNCTFSGNSASWGGGMLNLGSNPNVINCSFSGNSANIYGGGIHNEASNARFTNCTFSGNSTMWGGGMENAHSSPTLTNCTFSGNSAGVNGGGMDNYFNSYPTLANCILWANTASSGAQIYNDMMSSATVSYSDVQGGWGGTGNIDEDPCFVDADGDDDIVGTEDDNLRLLADSNCIDAGDNTAVPGGVTTDLDGKPRFFDDPFTVDAGNGTPPIVDMGAYEYQPPLPPSIIYVDADATGGANNGTSWSDAYLYLQDALADANSNPDINELRVADGTYKPDANSTNPSGTNDRTATFQLINGVAIYGGYAGYWAAEPNERDIELYETILSGDINTPGDNSDNSYHVVTGSGTDLTAVLDGFTITASNANSSSAPHRYGGGMYNDSGNPTINNCTFSGNSAGEHGGGMYNYVYSSPTVTNCTFSGNSATVGGGMCNDSNSSPTVTNCTFSGNTAVVKAGGMYNYKSSPTVTNCAFRGNSADRSGGMENSNNSSPTVTNCTFSENSAGTDGGGMYNTNSDPNVTNCILWGNSASNGPQIYNVSSSPTVSYSDVQGGYGGTGNIDDDPLFIDPNGLDRIAGTADDEEGYVHLRGYSPCINAGDPGGDYSGQVDIDSQPRVAYGQVDMGADEVFPIAGDYEPDGDVDLVDFGIFANNWLLGM